MTWLVLDDEVARAATEPTIAPPRMPEWRRGRPDDAAVRSTKYWLRRRQAASDSRFKLQLKSDGLRADFAPFEHDEASQYWGCVWDIGNEADEYCPADSAYNPLPWPAQAATPVATPSTSVAATTPRLSIGDVVACSMFRDGEAGVRIDDEQKLQRNLGVGVVEGCWRDHSRYTVKSIATDEVHTWPATALATVENWGLKVGDEVVTPRYIFVVGVTRFNAANMEKFVDKTGRIQSLDDDDTVRVHNYWWPIDLVAGATAKAQLAAREGTAKVTTTTQTETPQATRKGRVPTAEEIDAHDKAYGGRWRGQTGPLSMWIQNNRAIGWVSANYLRPEYAWDLRENDRCTFVEDLNVQPVDAAGNVVPWPVVTPKVGVSAAPAVAASPPPSKLPRDGDAITVEGAVAVAEEGARRAFKSMLENSGATNINVQSTTAGGLVAIYDVTPKPFAHEITIPLQLTQETTMTTASSTSSPNTGQPSNRTTSILDELKEDGVEVGYRLAASETVEITRDVLVDLLTAEVAEREQSLAKDYAREMLSSKAGLALVGLAASFGLPAVAKAVDRGEDPRVLRLARECRREGAMPGLKLLAGKLRGLLTSAGSRLLGVFDKLPAEQGGIEVSKLDATSTTPKLPENVSPELAAVLGGARCTTVA